MGFKEEVSNPVGVPLGPLSPGPGDRGMELGGGLRAALTISARQGPVWMTSSLHQFSQSVRPRPAWAAARGRRNPVYIFFFLDNTMKFFFPRSLGDLPGPEPPARR